LRAWYPTSRSPGAKKTSISYAQQNKFDEQVIAAKVITSVGAAVKNARPARSGPYPLVVFSHGYGVSPIVFSALIEHYASYGFVVLAPEHNETFDQSLGGFWKALIDRPADVRRTIDFAQTLTRPDGTLAGLIDMQKIAAVGHSYGGYTALAAAGARFDFAAYQKRCAPLAKDDPLTFFCAPVIPRAAEMASRAGLPSLPNGLWPSLGDPRVKATISMAGDAYPFDEQGLAELKVPMMAMGGTVDEGTPYTWGTKLTYDHAGSADKTMITFPRAGHMLFMDSCETLPWTKQSIYAEQLCNDAVWGSKRPLDIVTHYSTAFLLDTLNGDKRARTARTGKQPRLENVIFETTARPIG
jgi:predicted dienelactone hydrolase